MRQGRRTVGFVAFVAAALAILVAAGLARTGPHVPEVDLAARERAAFGLSSDSAIVGSLLGSTQDVGSSRWGLPLTASEESALDLYGRMAFVEDVSRELLPYARRLAIFGGAYIDQREGGELVILLTRFDPDEEARILAMRPEAGPSVRVRLATFTEGELRVAARRAWSAWHEQFPDIDLLSVAVDTASNRLQLQASRRRGLIDLPRIAALRAQLGVTVRVQQGSAGVTVSCVDREDCRFGIEAGSVIRRDSASGPRCTMGFQIRIGTDIQFLTSGHCGSDGKHRWFQRGAGLVGVQEASLYRDQGADLMRVQLAEPQRSAAVFGDSRSISGSAYPLQGQLVCASLGRSDRVDCGTVAYAFTSWTDSICNCVSWGGDVDGIAIQHGDSGSPLYSLGHEPERAATAIGILSTTSGYFAFVEDALQAWGAALVVTEPERSPILVRATTTIVGPR